MSTMDVEDQLIVVVDVVLVGQTPVVLVERQALIHVQYFILIKTVTDTALPSCTERLSPVMRYRLQDM